ESFSSGSAAAGGGTCSNYLNGFLPARAIGFQPVDSAGYALDYWNNRIRYAVAQTASNPSGATGCRAPAAPAYSIALTSDANGACVWHEPRPTGASGGEFDDLMVWIPIGQFYGKLIAAGVLP